MLAQQVPTEMLWEALKQKGYVEPADFHFRIGRSGRGVTDWPGQNRCEWQPRSILVKPWAVLGCNRYGYSTCTCARVAADPQATRE